MHSSKKIKICKVESQSFAKFCLLRKADFLGVHVIEYALDESKQALIEYITSMNGKAILLTKEKDEAKLKELLSFYKPWGLQLHYPINATTQKRLESSLNTRVIPVITNDAQIMDVEALLSQSEFVIYDSSFVGGTGKTHDRRLLQEIDAQYVGKIFLAGGITPELIVTTKDAIGGFDVQSYCREDGRHHYGKTEKIIDVVKGSDRRQLSVSLTDANGLDNVPDYATIKSIEYHIDYSEGNLYEHLFFDTQKLKTIISSIDAPFTLHIFEKNISSFQRVIDEFMAIGKNNIVRINIQYSPGLKIDEVNTYNAKLCASLYYKDAEEYVVQYPQQHACVSIILPTDLPRKAESLAAQQDTFDLMKDKELWFDRRVDMDTMKLVQKYYPDTNFIAGKYILEDWNREAELIEELANG